MLSRLRAFLGRAPRGFRILATLSLVLLASGPGANMLVMYANGGRMPVAVKSEQILFSIGPARFGVTYFMDERDFEDSPRHQAMKDDMHFLILADRIPLSLTFMTPYNTPHVVWQMLDSIQLPVGGEAIISPGDIGIWGGIIISYVLLAMLILWLLVGIVRTLLGSKDDSP